MGPSTVAVISPVHFSPKPDGEGGRRKVHDPVSTGSDMRHEAPDSGAGYSLSPGAGDRCVPGCDAFVPAHGHGEAVQRGEPNQRRAQAVAEIVEEDNDSARRRSSSVPEAAGAHAIRRKTPLNRFSTSRAGTPRSTERQRRRGLKPGSGAALARSRSRTRGIRTACPAGRRSCARGPLCRRHALVGPSRDRSSASSDRSRPGRAASRGCTPCSHWRAQSRAPGST